VIAALLDQLDFRGDIVLEVARCPPGEELEYAQRNLAFVKTSFGQSPSSEPSPHLHS
jgi:hypothetical protein